MNGERALLVIATCFVLSAFFSGSESGLLSISHARLMHLVRAGSRSARILNAYVLDVQRVLATVLVGNNLVNVVLSTASASFAQGAFAGYPVLQAGWAIGVACLMLVFCEFLPKLFFTTRPLRRTLLIARVFQVVEWLLRPLTALVLYLTKWMVPQRQPSGEQRFLITREYIQNVVSDPKDGSRITAVERLMINRVLALQNLTAAQVMTPLARVSRTTAEAALEDCYRLVRDSGHVRLPVFSEDGARCVGILNALDVLAAAPAAGASRASSHMRAPFFVAGETRADDVLPLMRKARQPMAVVRGADGKAVGIITEENILSALTGNL